MKYFVYMIYMRGFSQRKFDSVNVTLYEKKLLT